MSGPSNETENEKRLERIALALERIAGAVEGLDKSLLACLVEAPNPADQSSRIGIRGMVDVNPT